MNIIFKTGLAGIAYAVATGADAAELGRLFYTPQQRAELEWAKIGADRSLGVDGIVQRNGGKRTVWVNGVPQLSGESDPRVPEKAQLFIPGQAKPVQLKVGQQVRFKPADAGP